MKGSKISTALVVIAAVTVLTILAFHVRIGATADAVAVLQTDGMTCGNCSDRITTALASLDGVAVTEVDLDGGWVIVGYDSKSVTPDMLAAKVSATGFASRLQRILTPEEFRQLTGRTIGRYVAPAAGCCGIRDGGCGGSTYNQEQKKGATT